MPPEMAGSDDVLPSDSKRIYSNNGNLPLLELLDLNFHRLLDIGCGSGDNAALIKRRHAICEIFGVTYSNGEANKAKETMAKCWVFDAEGEMPSDILQREFDVLLFSHVLEHFRDPAAVVARYSKLLRHGGQVLIAVPNVLSWRMRIQFLLGRFEYEPAGVLDDTHLRFFTYVTADKYLFSKSPDLVITHKVADGNVPLWLLRRYMLPSKWAEFIDQCGSRTWPNLFGGQVLIRAIKQ